MYVQGTKQLKGALSGLRQILATESPLKMTKNKFISLFHIFIFNLLSRYLDFCLDFLVV